MRQIPYGEFLKRQSTTQPQDLQIPNDFEALWVSHEVIDELIHRAAVEGQTVLDDVLRPLLELPPR